ncbi:hypothetical protein DPMN_067159 [Dreissena polymorpha]|uniref:Uncharacterized protein n=1 Tax=Dreissena polymorpha TaxID=45954 RepID=A0A9D4BL47_DREPO|nr:hypothetical protein DPMN_067159 [Dreissena polymorpha]
MIQTPLHLPSLPTSHNPNPTPPAALSTSHNPHHNPTTLPTLHNPHTKSLSNNTQHPPYPTCSPPLPPLTNPTQPPLTSIPLTTPHKPDSIPNPSPLLTNLNPTAPHSTPTPLSTQHSPHINSLLNNTQPPPHFHSPPITPYTSPFLTEQNDKCE